MQAVYGVSFALFVVLAVTIAIKLLRYQRLTRLLQAIRHSISDGMVLIGENGQVKEFNDAALRILSLPEMDESAIGEFIQSPSEQGVASWRGRLIERLKTDVPGCGQLYVFRDLTEQRRLQVKLTDAERLESLGRVVGRVGHELNNLLTGAMGNAGLALDKLPPGDPVTPMLEDVLRASERAAGISRQLLAYSGSAKSFTPRPIDLSALVEDMARGAQASIPERVQFRMELRRDLPLAEADVKKIRQVAQNLIANSAEAIGDAQGIVTVRTGVEETATGSHVYLEVQDNGCGMDEETKSRIFDPFFTTKSAGRGLGLAAVLGIVQAHCGAITVHSEPDRGSTFRVLLPVPAHPIKHRSASAE